MRRFTGTGTLLRFALRRDRVVLPAWVLLYLLYSVGGTAAAIALYPDERSRLDAASAVNDMPAMLVLYGRVWDPHGLASVAMMKPIGFGGVFAAVLAILFITRHTRSEEESGRVELVASLVVGRWATLASALLQAAGVLLVIAVINAIGVTASGLPASGAWAWALSCSLTGLVFAALAGVTAQLTQSARAANTIALVALVLSLLLRGTSDAAGTAASSAWWAWLSPVGWQDQVRAFAGDRWGVMPLFVIATLVLLVVAFALAGGRDLSAGLLPERAGRPRASSALSGAFALALRLQRGLLLGLFASFACMALLLGAIASTSTKFMDSESMRTWLTAVAGTSDPYLAFVVFEMGFAALMTTLCAIVFARRLGVEEQAGRVEPVLATAVSHTRLFAAYSAVTALVTVLLQLTLALGFWLANGTQTGDYGNLGQTLQVTLVYLPAIWLVAGIAIAMLGLTPNLTYVAWIALSAVLVIGEFGPMFHWPSIVMDISPFTHVPRIPVVPLSWTPVAWLLATTAALVGAGFAGFRSRDLATP